MKGMYSGHSLALDDFKKPWRNLETILPIVINLSVGRQDNRWDQTKLHIYKNILLPIAREEACKQSISSRIYAASVFGEIASIEDEAVIINLISDHSPFVFFSSAKAGLRLGSKKITELIIRRIAFQRGLERSETMDMFKNCHEAVPGFITEILKSNSDPEIRATCYNVISHTSNQELDIDLAKDLESANIDLKLAAIKLLVYLKGVDAIEELQHQLITNNPIIKLVIIHKLGQLKSSQTIKVLESCLTDNNHMVALSAAKSLIGLGPLGSFVVKQHMPDFDINNSKSIYKLSDLW